MSEQIKGAKYDAGKIPLSEVPTGITWAIGAVRKYGLEKYGDAEDWGLIEENRWADAAYRHFLKYLEDPESVDSESGLPHLWHLAANIAFMIELNPESLRRVNGLADGVFAHNPFPVYADVVVNNGHDYRFDWANKPDGWWEARV